MTSPWHTNLKASHAPGEWGLTPLWVLPSFMRWCTAPLWRTSAELRAGQHRTPSQDSTVSALSQFLPVCWVTGNGREELAGVTLAALFPLHLGMRAPFSSSSSVPWTAYITRSDRQIGNVSVMYGTLGPWWRERRRYVPMPQSWTIAGCQGLVLGSSA